MDNINKQILVINSDLTACRQFQETLQSETLDVHYTMSTSEALTRFMKEWYCLIIVDAALEDTSLIDLLQIMRRVKAVPVLVVAAAPFKTVDEIAILSAGAVACMKMPEDFNILIARVHSLIRFYFEATAIESKRYTLTFGTEVIIDPAYYQVFLNGVSLDLTRREFEVLYLLASHDRQVLSKEQLYSYAWDSNCNSPVDEAVKSCIKVLRKKLALSGKEYIQNVRGVGYRFVCEASFR